MSPEQARGEVERLGPAADIYSLGATLYYMLTGQAPFTEQDIPEILSKVERGEFRPPRESKPGVDRALEAICMKAMALRPEDRYASRALAGGRHRALAGRSARLGLSRADRDADGAMARAGASNWSRRGDLVPCPRARRPGVSRPADHDGTSATTAQLGMTREALRELLDIAGSSLALRPEYRGIARRAGQACPGPLSRARVKNSKTTRRATGDGSGLSRDRRDRSNYRRIREFTRKHTISR